MVGVGARRGIALAGLGTLFGRGGALGRRTAGGGLAAQPAALAGGFVVLRLAAAGARLLAAPGLLVHRRPGARLGLVVGHAAGLVALLDVLGLAFLLVRIGRLVTAGHGALREWKAPSLQSLPGARRRTGPRLEPGAAL